ncbi:hypothetical protein [Thalassiella azotivora]
MTPKKLRTRQGDVAQARARRDVARAYRDVAELVAAEDGAAVNVCVGLAVLAGIAAGDSICLSATGERYAGPDHAAAAELLERVDRNLGRRLRRLVAFKPASHYGERILDDKDRLVALRDAVVLVDEATRRCR